MALIHHRGVIYLIIPVKINQLETSFN